MTFTNARGQWLQHDFYVKERDRAHVLREWDKENDLRRAQRLLRVPPNGCAMCKLPIDGTVYLYQKKRYHKICHSIVCEKAQDAGTWKPSVPICANGQLLGFNHE